MKPFLSFGWQPQVMAVSGPAEGDLRRKAGGLRRRRRSHGSQGSRGPGRIFRDPCRWPSETIRSRRRKRRRPWTASEPRSSASSRASATSARPPPPPVRKDAPRPADMIGLFDVIEKVSGLFVREEYVAGHPAAGEDPGRGSRRTSTPPSTWRARTPPSDTRSGPSQAFEKAAEIAPDSQDVRTYLALHYARGKQWERAVPLLERIVAEAPDRLPALEALAVVRERQGRTSDAIALRQKIYGMRSSHADGARPAGPTGHERRPDGARNRRASRKHARSRAAPSGTISTWAFSTWPPRRLPEAKESLDRVSPSDPAYPMALFKRAQVSVLLQEPDQAARIALARQRADATTRELIATERLFPVAPARR